MNNEKIYNYDKNIDVLVIRVSPGEIIKSDQITSAVIADYSECGNIMRLEILDASKNLMSMNLSSTDYEDYKGFYFCSEMEFHKDEFNATKDEKLLTSCDSQGKIHGFAIHMRK